MQSEDSHADPYAHSAPPSFRWNNYISLQAFRELRFKRFDLNSFDFATSQDGRDPWTERKKFAPLKRRVGVPSSDLEFLGRPAEEDYVRRLSHLFSNLPSDFHYLKANFNLFCFSEAHDQQ